MRLITAIAAIVLAAAQALAAATPTGRYTPPAVPDSIEGFTARVDRFTSAFWPLGRLQRKGVESRPEFAEAFKVWLDPVEQATADTVYASVAALMGALASHPDDQFYAATLAEDYLYGDSAQFASDELYRAFLKPVLRNKKLAKGLKARFEQQFTILGNTLQGYPMAPVAFTDNGGGRRVLEPREGAAMVVFINDPDCLDCRMARARLAASVAVERLHGEGRLDVTALSLCDPSEPLWAEFTAPMPEWWTVGADPALDSTLDLRGPMPCFYLIDSRGRLAAKSLDIDQVLDILNTI